MSTEKGYNGWTNYETWNVALWLDNDEATCNDWAYKAQEAYDAAEAERSFTREERAALDLSYTLKEEFEEATPELSGCFADLLRGALSEVNWHEIAEHYIENVDKEEVEKA